MPVSEAGSAKRLSILGLLSRAGLGALRGRGRLAAGAQALSSKNEGVHLS